MKDPNNIKYLFGCSAYAKIVIQGVKGIKSVYGKYTNPRREFSKKML